VAVEWKHHRCDRLKRPRVLFMDQWYLHVKTVFLGGGTQRSLLARLSPFPGALILRGDSWPHLPRVELIQKVSTKPQPRPLRNGACVLDYGPQFLPRRADDSCPVVSFVSPRTLPRTERIMFMKYILFALKMHSNRFFQFFSSGATCLTTSRIFETMHLSFPTFALQS